MSKRYLTRKDLALELEVSVQVVKNNEARWGLAGCKVCFNRRLIRYWRARAVAELKQRGLIE